MVMVILSTAGGANPKLRSIVMAICSGYINYQMIMAVSHWGLCGEGRGDDRLVSRGLEAGGLLQCGSGLRMTMTPLSLHCPRPPPHTHLQRLKAAYYSDWINHIWNGLWTGIVYTCILLVRGL